MFGKSKKKGNGRYDDELRVNIINSTTSIEGNIICQSSIRYDGKLNGEINTVNKIIIGDKAVINGTLLANDIEIFGLVKGDSYAKNSITLSSPSNYKGNIFTKQMTILEGAVFNGNIEMKIKNMKLEIKAIEPEFNNLRKNLLQKIAVYLFILFLF